MLFGHLGKYLIPTAAWSVSRSNDHETIFHLKFHSMFQVALFQDSLRQAYTFGVADAYNFGFHERFFAI